MPIKLLDYLLDEVDGVNGVWKALRIEHPIPPQIHEDDVAEGCGKLLKMQITKSLCFSIFSQLKLN